MKKLILLVICIFLCVTLFAEKALWVTAEDTPAWKTEGKYIRSYIHNITKTFPKGTKVILDYNIYNENITDKDGYIEYTRDAYIAYITVDDEEYTVEAKNIIPVDTPDLFDNSFLTVAHYPHRYLIASYLSDVLKSGTRSTMYKYEKDYIERYIRVSDHYDGPWWTASVLAAESIITQGIIYISSLRSSFLVKQIEKIPNGYKVDVIKTPLSNKREYSLFLQFDGDYVDVYEDNLSNKVLSLTYVNPDFYYGVNWKNRYSFG